MKQKSNDVDGSAKTIPSVLEVCIPREEVLSGKQTMDIFAANLSLVVQGKAPPIYQDPKQFFENTYPTEGLRTTITEVFGRLTGGKTGSPVIKLETSLGGGKTHTLIALYHLAKNGSKVWGAMDSLIQKKVPPLSVAAVVGTEMSTQDVTGHPRTLWGEIIQQLFGEDGYKKIKSSDMAMTSPGERVLRDIIGTTRCMVLIDETAIYLAKASAVQVAQSTLAEQTIAFLQELTQVASSLDNMSVVITTLNKETVFKERTKELQKILDAEVKESKAREAIGDADEVLSRIVRNLTPTQGEEFAAVVRYRLFKEYNRSAIQEICKAYHNAITSESASAYLPQYSREPQYLETLKNSYPFHPELINVLRTKTSSIPAFNKTRGVLRLLSLVVKHIWDNKIETPFIQTHHIDLSKAQFTDELVSRLDRTEYTSAIVADVANKEKPPRASLIDEQFNEPYASWIWTVTFLHSLVGVSGPDMRRGALEQEIYLSIFRPGLDLKKVENAMRMLEDIGGAFYLSRSGPLLAISVEPTLNRVIESAKDAVEETRILKEIEDRVQSLFGGRKYFEPQPFANEPGKVPDNTTKPKLVIMHFNDCCTTKSREKPPDEVLNIYEKQGTQNQPRVFINNLLFVVVDKEEKEKMFIKAKEFLALKYLLGADQEKGGIAELSKAQREKVDEKRKEAELFLKVAIIVAYRHIFVPTKQETGNGDSTRRTMRHLPMRVTDADVERRVKSGASQEEHLVQFLKENKAARDANDAPLDPDFVLEYLWPKKAEDVTADEFRKLFYRNPAADLILSEELITKSLREGIKSGRWYGYADKEFYDKSNHMMFGGGFSSDAQLILADSKTGEELRSRFICPECEKLIGICQCHKEPKKPGEEPKKPPILESNLFELPEARDMSLQRAAAELKAKLEDKNVSEISAVTFEALGRTALSRLASAGPQFIQARLKFKIKAMIDQRAEGKNLLRIEYEGDLAGFNAAKTVLVNYEGRSDFSTCDIKLEVSFEPPISVASFIELLLDKVGNFTQDSTYNIIVQPVRKEA